ncbi:hypothetical protein NKR23_g5170 [Pleurostoma richardsiae]|uniref:Copper homeostasis protein cutC homolog n=1 Tax=Pleurostoma richardsiae TaxID=41990 RepID=A0AA38RHN0_9PEZI|nr:hypothetical protein NKR23_g5170 [Pleurostoma richardsiae]
METLLEVPAFSVSSAVKAVSNGAGRIELNRQGSYPDGGLTPGMPDLEALTDLPVPVRIMVRPRGPPASGAQDFIYIDDEFEDMKYSIAQAVQPGRLRLERGDGFVFGILRQEDGGLLVADFERNQELVRLARPFKCVFHRAFDDIIGGGKRPQPAESRWKEALESIVACGFDAILTSGGRGNAPDNLKNLKRVIAEAHGRIETIVGGGVRSHNVGTLGSALGRQDRVSFHSSCLTHNSGEEVDTDEVTKTVWELATSRK